MLHQTKPFFLVLIALVLGLCFTFAISSLFSVQARLNVQAADDIRYVAPGGTDGTNTCVNSYTPCATIQHAVDMAAPDDEIRVAAGNYTDISVRDGIAQVVHIDKSIVLRGGFAATNWNTPNPETNLTTLNAGGQGLVMVITGTITATVEGLRITGGVAPGPDCAGICVVQATVALSNNVIFGNSAQGVLVVFGKATLSNNTIYSNTTEYGGGVYVTNGQVILHHNTIRYNQASRSGGGVTLDYFSIAQMDGNTITNNSAGENGGGVYAYYYSQAAITNTIIADNQAGGQGSGVYADGASISLRHATLARNSGGDGSGLHVTGSGFPAGAVSLTNTILVSHAVGITVAGGSAASLEATLWGAGSWANGLDWGGTGTIATGTTNIWGDPLFAAPDAGNYHLRFGSAALDQGVNAGVTTDIDGEPRPYNGVYDLGADEGQPGLTVTKETDVQIGKAGTPLTYTIRVTNSDFISLTATITDILPGHVTPTGILNWSPPLIPPGDTWTQQVAVTIETGYTGTLTNVVQVTGAEGASGVYTHTLSAGRVYYLPVILKEG